MLNANEVLSSFFQFNDVLVPNWSGHFILASLMLIFPGFVAEKMLLSFILLAIPLLLRKLIYQENRSNLFLSYFAFPLTFSFAFGSGFYNFLLGVVLLLFHFTNVGCVSKIKDQKRLNSLYSPFYS